MKMNYFGYQVPFALAAWLYDRENKEFSLKENGGISNEYQG